MKDDDKKTRYPGMTVVPWLEELLDPEVQPDDGYQVALFGRDLVIP